jgi:hypothetical protein
MRGQKGPGPSVDRRTARNEPWTANYPPLHEWLKRVDGRCLWQQKNGTSMIEGWAINGVVAIIHVYGNGNGWNIYTACPSNRIDLTLQDAEARCGRDPKEEEQTA